MDRQRARDAHAAIAQWREPGAQLEVVVERLQRVDRELDHGQVNSPEAYIQFKPGLITPEGEVTVESTAESCATT